MINNKVAIIIVNWNGVSFLRDCLSSVYNQTYTNFDVYFVDNGSVDNSVEFVQKNFPKTIILKLKTNTGFSYANNVGIHEACKDDLVKYIFTLNNDTVVDTDCIFHLVKSIETDSTISSVSPKTKFLKEDTIIDNTGLLISLDGGGMNRGHKEKDVGQYDTSGEIFGVCAGAALYRRDALYDVMYRDQFFDDSFFAYYEDLDLAWRLRLRGWKSWYCAEALVLHIHSGTGVMYSPLKAYHVNRNRFFLIIKDFPIKYMVYALLITPYRYIKLFHSMIFKKSGASYELKKKTNFLLPFLLAIKGWGSLLLQIPFLLLKRYTIQSRKKVRLIDVQKWFEQYSASVNDMIYK